MNLPQSAGQCAREAGPVCAAIGFFDGLHLGHQQVVQVTRSEAVQRQGQTVVVTFDRHPLSVVAPHRAPGLIYPLWKKLQLLEAAGATAVWLLPFDEIFSRTLAPDFIRQMVHGFHHLASVSVGCNFHFGHQRSGNLESLTQLGQKMRFSVNGVPAAMWDGAPVSSTRIREAIRSGRLTEAARLLGRPYALCGQVLRGDQLGRTLGFPTANLEFAGLTLPPEGVYAAWALLGGRKYAAVLNHGFRPTLRTPRPQRQVEAHLLDFSADIYGRELEIELVEKLRDEIRFAHLDVLKEQIAADVRQARSRLSVP